MAVLRLSTAILIALALSAGLCRPAAADKNDRDLIITNETDATLTVEYYGRGELVVPPRTRMRFPDLMRGTFTGYVNAPCVAGTPTKQFTVYITGEARRDYEFVFRASDFGKSVMFDGPSCPYTSSPGNTAECLRIVGRWNWFTGSVVDFMSNNTWQTADGRHTGRWSCAKGNAIVVTPDVGTWRDTVRVGGDGKSLAGANEQGVRVSAQRVDAIRRDCPTGYNPYGCN